MSIRKGKGSHSLEETTSVAHLEDKQDLLHTSNCLACVCIHNLTIPMQSVSKLVWQMHCYTIKICRVLSWSQHAAMCWVVPCSVPRCNYLCIFWSIRKEKIEIDVKFPFKPVWRQKPLMFYGEKNPKPPKPKLPNPEHFNICFTMWHD